MATKLAGASLLVMAVFMEVSGGHGDLMSHLGPDPRFAGSYAPLTRTASLDAGLHVVTLNIEFGRRIDLARRLFASAAELGRADVVLLQEMDAEGTDELAAFLGMNYVYYPATVHPRTGRAFGNAVLARWPITADYKINLPHRSIYDGSLRAATCATLTPPLGPVEVCSLHVATRFELLPSARRAQVRAVLERLRAAPRVILGGDLNSYRLGKLPLADGFAWTTRDIGHTVGRLSVDHLFARGLSATGAGRVTDTLGATDHAAVWATFVWP